MNSAGRGSKHTAVVIPAGGRGTRMGGPLPKQFLRLGGMSILERTVRAFEAHPEVREIVIVCSRDHEERVRRMVSRRRLKKVTGIVRGGKVRQESVWNGIRSLQSNASLVLIQDAVRPFVTRKLISQVIAATARCGAAVPAVQVKETLLAEGNRGQLRGVIDRAKSWVAQTPQGFQRDLIEGAFRSAQKKGFVGTDDASLVLRLHHPVFIVTGSEENIKITTPRDLEVARLFLKRK
ncbi:MAG: 2-C-methyl-D-erythritol 4-phosphate cytidylyltransferase [Bacteroidota bacterium]